MFENLSERLERSFKILKGEGKITEINVAETLKDVRRALLDADVNYKVAKNFTDTVKQKAMGMNVLTAVKPSQLMVKIVHDELTELMGGKAAELKLENRPAIILMSGLQGSGKTTFTGKLANMLKTRQHKNPLLVACDVYRPAAIEQLKVVAYRHKLVEQRVKLQVRSKEKDTVRGKSKALSFVERKTRHLIEELSKAIKQCDDKMKEIIAADEALRENYDIITSMRGVALQNAACLMIYTNNFKKFDYDSRKIACYYGVAPFGKQSGTSVNLAPRTSHFANKLIKSLLGQAAHVAKEFEPEIRAYYDRMIQKGKKRQVAINNVKNKILHILVAMVKKKEKYNPNSNKKENVKDFALCVNF